MFYYILRFGSGSLLVANVNPSGNPVGFYLYLFVGFCLLIKSRSYFRKIFKNVVLWLTILWVVIQKIIAPTFAPFDHFIFVFDIILGLSMAYLYKESIVYYYEKILVTMSGLSIFFWVILLAFGPNVFPHLLKGVAFGEDCWSILIYTINDISSGDLYFNLTRNPGFAWEPGLFATLIVIAIVFNILLNNGKINFKNKSFIILVLALLTTFSTTGYVALLLIFVLHYINGTSYSLFTRLLITPLLVIGAIYVYNLPFVSGKLEEQTKIENYRTSGSLDYWESTGQSLTVQRFEGLQLDLLNIYDKPLFGYGVARGNSFVCRTISQSLITSNGILKPFAMFGIFLALPIFVLFYISSKKLMLAFHYSNFSLLFISILILSISYDLFQVVIIHALQFYCFTCKRLVYK